MSNAEELAENDALFARADKANDGEIGFPELRGLIRELDEEEIAAETLRIGFAETDTDRNGRINIDEFRDWRLSP